MFAGLGLFFYKDSLDIRLILPYNTLILLWALLRKTRHL